MVDSSAALTAISLDRLAEAFRIGARSHIALVGGGGKSTLLHAFGDQLEGAVALTSTTKMGADQHLGRQLLIAPTDDEIVAAAHHDPVMVWSGVDGHKAIGVDPARCDAWFRRIDHVVVEADGSRRLPFKAPADHEPIVPSTATLVISVIGADALGKVIADRCHRPLRVAALAGCRPDVRLEPWMAAVVILHVRGAAKALPPGAELAVAINKVDARNVDLVDRLVDELRARRPAIRIVTIAARSV